MKEKAVFKGLEINDLSTDEWARKGITFGWLEPDRYKNQYSILDGYLWIFIKAKSVLFRKANLSKHYYIKNQ